MGLGITLLFIIQRIVDSKKAMQFPRFLYLVIPLFIYHFIWDSFNNTIQDQGLLSYLIKNQSIHIFCGILLIYNTRFDEGLIKKIIIGIKITIVAAFLTTVYQLLYDFTFLIPPEMFKQEIIESLEVGSIYELRNHSFFLYSSRNEIGYSYIPLISVFFGFYLTKKINLIKIAPYLLMAGFVCFATNGRYMQLGFLLVMMQYLIINRKKLKKSLLNMLLIGLVGILFYICFVVFFVGYDLQQYIEQRILSDSAGTRILALESVFKFFPQNMWFGTGVDTKTIEIITFLRGRSSQIHVGYFACLISYGLIGSIILFGLWGSVYSYLYRSAKFSNYYGALFAFIMFLWVNVVMIYYYFFTYGIMLAFVFDKYFRDRAMDKKPESASS